MSGGNLNVSSQPSPDAETSNELLEIDAVVVWRIVGGKIAEAWDIPAVHTAHPVQAKL